MPSKLLQNRHYNDLNPFHIWCTCIVSLYKIILVDLRTTTCSGRSDWDTEWWITAHLYGCVSHKLPLNYLKSMPHNPMPVNLLWVGESALARQCQQPPSDLQDTRLTKSGSGVQRGFVSWYLIFLKDYMHGCGGPYPKTHEEKKTL